LAGCATARGVSDRLKKLLAEYGRLALVTYLVLFALSLAGFAAAIAFGFEVESAAGGAGLLGAAYLGTKAIQPLRIAATLALTPLVARLLGRRGRPAVPTAREVQLAGAAADEVGDGADAARRSTPAG